MLIVGALVAASTAHPAETWPRSGPAARFTVSDTKLLTAFKEDLPVDQPDRELRLQLSEAITLTATEKRGIPGGGGVREVPITVYGNVILTLPVINGKIEYAQSRAEVSYIGAQRISASGPVQPHPQTPASFDGRTLTGKIRCPVALNIQGRAKPTDPFNFDIEFDLKISDETFKYTPDPDPAIPPWRSDKSKPSGRKVTGKWKTYELRSDSVVELDGTLAPNAGCLRVRSMPGIFSPVGSIELARGNNGLDITAYNAESRVAHGESVWAAKTLDTPLDLRTFNGIRLTVSSAQPYAGRGWTGPAPATVAVALRVRGGQWFVCRSVTPLLGGEQTYIADFGLFMRGVPSPGFGSGPNSRYFLTLDAIDAVAVGINNPFGIGTVRFTAHRLEAVRYQSRGHGEPITEAAVITVDPALGDSLNGEARVPKALFGFHVTGKIAKPENPDPNLPAYFREPPYLADPIALLRALKPGSLRPLDHTGMSPGEAQRVTVFDWDTAEAGDAADEVMTTVTNQNLWARPDWMDKIKKDTPENLAATRDAYAAGIREMFARVGEKAWHPQERPRNTLRLIEFWNEPFMWARHINRGTSTLSAGPGDPGGNRGRQAWDDPTQFTYLPGRLGGEMYGHFFNAAHEGLKSTNPHVRIGGLSGPSFGEEFGEHLRRYWDAFFAVSRDRIEFLSEHHYQGDPDHFAADYEMVTAYTLAKYGKQWPIWNTEANDLEDIAPGDRRSAEAAKAFQHMNRAYYNYRDILELILKSRDKARGRAIHAFWAPGILRDPGEYQMYKIAADLRGDLVTARTTDSHLIPCATLNDGRLVILLLNDTALPRDVVLHLPAGPKDGSQFACTALYLHPVEERTSTEPVALTTKPVDGKFEVRFARPMEPREIRKVVVEAGVYPARPAATAETRQAWADTVLLEMKPGETREGAVALGSIDPATINRAVLRVVTRDVHEGEAVVELAGGAVSIPLPSSRSASDSHIIQDLPLTPEQWSLVRSKISGPSIPIRIRCDAAHDGFGFYMASLNLTRVP
jgi:hypothetical protein